MYRTPMRRDLSPDSPALYRDSPRSREGRSWSRGRSPPRRSPGRHSRSPGRRSRSPGRRSRSPGRRSRSPVRHGRSSDRRGRSRSRHRSRSRPAEHARSKSRGRRSRSRPRRSPSPYSKYPARRRSPEEPYRYESRGDPHRHSPSYRSSTASDHRPRSSSRDRSSGTKSYESSSSSSRVYQSSSDSTSKPLPMPKKSILKKRTDMEPASRDQSPQVDDLSSNKDGRSVSSTGAGKSVEQASLTTDSQQLSSLPMAVKMGLLNSSAQTPESPHQHGSAQPIVATSWTLSNSAKIGMEGSVSGQTPPCEQTDGRTVSPYSSTLGNMLFNKSGPNSQAASFSGMNVFPEHKEDAPKRADQASSFMPYEQDSKSSQLLSKTLDPKQKRSTEIEDEERFLYGDEDDKKPEPQKASSVQAVPASPAKDSPDKQEFEKIHDLLKTIGLDIGVAEIGELAVRTQERLHGKKLVPKMSQPAAEKPQSKAAANPKAEVSEQQIKTEKTEKPETVANNKPQLKPALKETTPPATPQSPAPVPKEKPQLILRKSLPKEATAAPKVETPVQPPAAPPPIVQPPTAPPPIVQPRTVPQPVVQPPTVPQPVIQPPTVQPPVTSPVADPTPPPISPSQMPVYTPYPHSPMVPRYSMPPPNYNPYTPYVSYPTSNWTMYSQMPPQQPPPHIMTPPAPHMSVPVSTPTPQYNPRSNLRVIETTEDLTEAKAAVKPDAKPTTLAELLAKQEAERKNKESEKLKVLEELDSVRKEHKLKKENLKTLSAKVDQLRTQQGILLRKKRREKDGHKDPLLEELSNVLESALRQMSSLCEEISTWRHKQHQLTKVAEILGVSPSDLAEKREPKKERSPDSPSRNCDIDLRTNSDSSKSSNDLKANNDQTSKADVKDKSVSKSGDETKSVGISHLSSVTKSEDVKIKGTPPRQSPNRMNSPEPRSPNLSKSEDVKKSRDKSRSKSPRPCTTSSKKSSRSEEPPPFRLSEIFEFYDSGSHWCEDCNAICLTLSEFLLHLHDKKHNQCVKEEKTPWVKKPIAGLEPPKKQKVNIPLKGSEFMVPACGYYCDLCKELFPDHISAEEHLRAYAHNDKYKKLTDANIDYEKQRREKKKASLMAAQEASRMLAEIKRKLTDQKHEAHEHSRSKKAKKEEYEEEKKSKSKRHASASPPSSDQKRNKMPEKESQKNQKRNKTPEKEPSRNQKRNKTPENESQKNQKRNKTPEKEPSKNPKRSKTPEKEPSKNQKRSKTPEKESSKNQKRSKTPEKEPSKNQKHRTPETESSKNQKLNKTPEKEPPKNPSLKFFWKTSENKNPVAVGASVLNIPKEEEPKTLTLKPKGFAIKLLGKSSTQPGNALSPSHSATPTTVTSTAPTTSTTSAASSSPTTSTSQTRVRPNLPSVVNVRAATPAVTMSKPAPLNTFLSIKSSNSASKSLPVVKNKPTSVNPEDLVSKASEGEVVLPKDSTLPESTDKPANKEQEKTTVKSPKVVHIIKKQDYLFNILVSKKEIVDDDKKVKSEKDSPGSKPPLPFSQKSDPVSTSTSGPNKQAQSPGSNVQQTQNTKSPVQNPAPSSVSSTVPVKFTISSSINSSSNNAKADSTSHPSNQQTGKAELTPTREESRVQAPPQAKDSSQLEKKTPKEVKASAFSMNPVTGRFEYLPVQETKPKETNVQKVPETKSMSTAVSHVSSVKPNKPASTPLVPMMKPRSTFNATTRLNQKFKRAPLSLPSSLFGHIQDTGCKDIKITSVESQKTNLLSPVQNKASSVSSAKPSPVNPNTMEQELDSYYKLIATEDDLEDLTTSEDQDSEVAPPLMNVGGVPFQTKKECPPDKKVKLESAPPVQAPMKPSIPDDSGEDPDDSDMACEVPDVSLNSVSGWNFMQSSYASSKVYGSSKQPPWNFASENRSTIKDKSTEVQVTTVATPENSMEDLSVYVTCDSD